MKIKSKIWLEKEELLIFGKGKSLIFKAIEKTGSINKAAKQLGMSFRHAWSYVNSVEKRLGKTLVEKNRGGSSGGGAALTAYAGKLLQKFDILEKEVREYTNKRFRKIFGD